MATGFYWSKEHGQMINSLQLNAGENGWRQEEESKATRKERVEQEILARAKKTIEELKKAKIAQKAQDPPAGPGQAQGSQGQ